MGAPRLLHVLSVWYGLLAQHYSRLRAGSARARQTLGDGGLKPRNHPASPIPAYGRDFYARAFLDAKRVG